MMGIALRGVPALWLAVATGLAHAGGPVCDDPLRRAGLSMPQLEYTGCEDGHSAQLRTQVATYRVRGSDAAAVERRLVRRTGMARLRFVCCGWEPDPRASRRLGTLRLGTEALEVSMGSGESAINRRVRWAQIPSFQVTVTRYLDAP